MSLRRTKTITGSRSSEHERRNLINVYKNQKGEFKEDGAGGGVQARWCPVTGKRQWAQSEAQEIPSEHQEAIFCYEGD